MYNVVRKYESTSVLSKVLSYFFFESTKVQLLYFRTFESTFTFESTYEGSYEGTKVLS
mgnify:CR=1 FL=1